MLGNRQHDPQSEDSVLWVKGIHPQALLHDGSYVYYLSGIAFYDANMARVQTIVISQFDTNGYNIPVIYTTDDSNKVTMMDFGDIAAYVGWNMAFIRLCSPDINGDSVVTVNELIK